MTSGQEGVILCGKERLTYDVMFCGFGGITNDSMTKTLSSPERIMIMLF